jgi:hypothetical protein
MEVGELFQVGKLYEARSTSRAAMLLQNREIY